MDYACPRSSFSPVFFCFGTYAEPVKGDVMCGPGWMQRAAGPWSRSGQLETCLAPTSVRRPLLLYLDSHARFRILPRDRSMGHPGSTSTMYLSGCCSPINITRPVAGAAHRAHKTTRLTVLSASDWLLMPLLPSVACDLLFGLGASIWQLCNSG